MRKDRWGRQAERYIGEEKKNEKGRKKRTRENKGDIPQGQKPGICHPAKHWRKEERQTYRKQSKKP